MAENSFKHKTPIEVRFSDIDAFGHVNNAKYLTYFEIARVQYFSDIVDWTYDWSKEGVIVARVEIDFIMPIKFRDEVIAMTRCSRIGTKSFDLQYRLITIKNGEEILLADGTTVMVAFDYVNRKPIEIPAEWREAIKKFEAPFLNG